MGRPPLDLTLYLVTDTRLCGAVGVATTAARAVRGGATVVQLRDPDCTDEELVRLGRSLREALPPGLPLIVDDRAHLVSAIGADGVHVGQHDEQPEVVRALVGDDAYVGLSVQTVEHVDRALSLPRGTVDYLGVGPVWPQSTKHDAAEASGPETLARIVRHSPWPCVAIGGIDAARVRDVRRTGAHGVAVVSAVCGQPDVEAATRRLREAWDQHRGGEP